MRELLDAASVAYEVDSTLVRGLDYYTRTVFEFTSDALGAQSGVGGGGRYDGLVEQLGGPPTPGMGWAAGDRADHARGRSAARGAPPVQLFLALDEQGSDGADEAAASPRGQVRASAFELLCEARSAGLTAQMELGGAR